MITRGKFHRLPVGFKKRCAIGTLGQVLFENSENAGFQRPEQIGVDEPHFVFARVVESSSSVTFGFVNQRISFNR